jgi:acetyltransferase
MKSFFESKKIAVIGASRSREKAGNVIFRNLLSSRLKVFPVNPKTERIEGVKSYPDVLSIPYPVDMAVVVVKAEIVPKILEECGRKGVKKVIIISAGFSEAGNKKLENKIEEIKNKYELKIIGPNVLGIINPYKNMNASFFKGNLGKGSIGIVSQSGAVGTSLLDKCLESRIGISGFVSLGNMLDKDFISSLGYFGTDVRTDVILLYIESLKGGTGRKFVELCKNISKNKKIIAIKSGKTKEGKEAAKTHTASLASNSKIYSGAFKQSGIIEVNSLDEALTLAKIFSRYGELGKKVGVITNAGGLGVLAVDILSKDFEISEIPEKVLEHLDSFLPEGYSRENPLDILGDALRERYEKTLKVLDMHNLYDFFVLIVSPQAMTQSLETAKLIAKKGKPVFGCFIGGKSFEEAKKYLTKEGSVLFNDVSELGVLGLAS